MNPEDNAFVTWLAAQLVTAGYEVWCDVTKLLGGERMWRDIEEAIDAHTFRFMFVSTLESNRKPGTLRELKLALEAQERHELRNFVVPLKLDGMPFEAMDARLRERTFIRFDLGWAAALAQLLDLLKREGAPTSQLASAAAVSEWRRRSLDPKRRVQIGPETAWANWFPVTLPETLWFHDLGVTGGALERAVSGFSRPHRRHGSGFFTFAARPEAGLALGTNAAFRRSVALRTEDFIHQGDEALGVAQFDASNMVTDLLAQAWNAAIESRGLVWFEMANRARAWFFRKDHLPKDTAHFPAPASERKRSARRKAETRRRQLVGKKSKRTPDGGKAPDGFWHYAVSAQPQLHPYPKLVLHHHVIFTEDGVTPWSNAERMAKARRSVCKNWWNAEWRDRLFATVSVLSAGAETMDLAAADDAVFVMATAPLSFVSPRHFFEDGQTGLDETADIELVEDADEDDDDGRPA